MKFENFNFIKPPRTTRPAIKISCRTHFYILKHQNFKILFLIHATKTQILHAIIKPACAHTASQTAHNSRHASEPNRHAIKKPTIIFKPLQIPPVPRPPYPASHSRQILSHKANFQIFF